MISCEKVEPGPTDDTIGSSITKDIAPSDLDKVKKLVEEEGRIARNLLVWNVPLTSSKVSPAGTSKPSSESTFKQEGLKMRKPLLSPKAQILTHHSHLLGTIDAHSVRPIKRFSQDKSKAYRIRSASAERDSKHDLTARYWAFLFENLQRAIDEIYQTCDAHESIIECKETIMMLENYIKEFTSLIEWLNLNKTYESAPPTERPTSLAWEVKKSSLSRSLPLSPTIDKKLSIAIGNSCKRQLVFASRDEASTQTGLEDDKKLFLNVLKEVASDETLSEKGSNQNWHDVHIECPNSEASDSHTVDGATLESAEGSASKVATSDDVELTEVQPMNVIKQSADKSNKKQRNATSVKKPVRSVRSVDDDKMPPCDKSQKVKPRLQSHSSLTSLHFDGVNDQKNGSTSSLSSTSSNGRSWADKVKGISHIPPIDESDVTKSLISTDECKQQVKQEEKTDSNAVRDDNEGWETVHRGKNKLRTPPPLSGTSTSARKSCFASKAKASSCEKINKRKTRQSFEHLPPKDHHKKTDCQSLSVKSLPSLNRKCPAETSQNSTKFTSQKKLTRAKFSNMAKSLPDVSNGYNNKSGSAHAQFNKNYSKNITKVDQKKSAGSAQKKNVSTSSVDKKLPKHDYNQSEQSKTANAAMKIELEKDDRETVKEDGEKKVLNWAEMVIMHEKEMAAADMAWPESMEQPEARQPGRALQMHEKLSSPSRKRSRVDTMRRHTEKQAKAQVQRDRLREEKAQKLRDQSKKVEEVRAMKEEQLLKKRGTMERRLEQAEQKRKKQIQLVVKKARDEEEKVNEIAFINTLEAQNKRLDVLSRHKDHEARLQDIQEERQRRQEEKAAKEAAAEERRKALETERLWRLHEMQEKRKQRDMKIEQQLQEKEKERLEQAREKQREREQRLSALTAAQNANAEELQRKIKTKQEESARRHEENIEQKRQKAFELSVRKYSSNNDDAPCLVPYEMVKMCTLCNVLITSEVYLLSHLRGKAHQEAVREKNEGKELISDEMESFNLKLMVDAPADKVDPRIVQDKERQKCLKKRCKKIRHRMMQRATEYENISNNKKQQVESENKAKLSRAIKEINKCIQNQGSGAWPSNVVSSLERSLGEVNRALHKQLVSDQIAFRVLGGLNSLIKLVDLISAETKDVPLVVPARILLLVCTVFEKACSSCRLNCSYVLYSNLISNIIDLTVHKFALVISNAESPIRSSPTLNVSISYASDRVAGHLMQLASVILKCLAQQNEVTDSKDNNEDNGFQLRATDLISYIVSVGLIDRIYDYFKTIQGPIDNDPSVAEFLHQSVMLLTGVVMLLSNKFKNAFGTRKSEDVTQLIATLSMTEIVGTISMLYGILLHSGAASPEGTMPPPELPLLTTNVALAVLQMLNHVAILDLALFQKVIGSEGTSLEFRHIASYLMWYCSHWPNEELLHEVIVLIGYFTVLNNDNQVVLQSGHCPTVLQQLCALPFNYFSDPFLTMILFPSLISCCHGNAANKDILEQDMSSSLLANFIEGRQFSLLQADLLPSKATSVDDRWVLQNRFPEDKWTEAADFFNS